MWPDIVVVVAPERQFSAGVIQTVEHLFIQKFISQAAVEWLDEGILLGLAGIDVVPFDAVVVGPLQDRSAGELGSIVTDNAVRFAIEPDERVQLSCNTGTSMSPYFDLYL